MSKSLCTNLTEKFLNGMNEVSEKRYDKRKNGGCNE